MPEHGSEAKLTEISQASEPASGGGRRAPSGGLDFRRTFSALRHRNFRYFFYGQLVSLIGTWMQNTAQSWLVYELTHSKFMLGIVTAASTAPLLLFSLLGGSVADRNPKRNVLVITQSVMMALAFALTALVWSKLIQPVHIIILAALAGIAMAFDMPTRQSFIVEMSSREDLMNAISLNSAIFNGARVIGPAVAGFIMARFGMGLCFFLNGLSFLAVLAGLLSMRLTPFTRPAQVDSHWAHMREGLAYALDQRRVRLSMLLLAVVSVFGWSYAVLLPAIASETFRTSGSGYGLLLGANGVGALFGALTVASAAGAGSRRGMVFGGLGLFCMLIVLLAFTRNFYLGLFYLAAAGWSMMLFLSTLNTIVQTSVSDEMRGRVMGIWALVFGGMTPLGGLQAGGLAHLLGISRTLILGASACALAGGLTLFYLLRAAGPSRTPRA